MDDGDVIDRMITDWREQLPGLDPSPLAVVGRVIVLARHLERSVGEALAAHSLSLDEFETAGLIERQQDPTDRRGVVVKLTAKGRETIETAAATRFAEAERSM